MLVVVVGVAVSRPLSIVASTLVTPYVWTAALITPTRIANVSGLSSTSGGRLRVRVEQLGHRRRLEVRLRLSVHHRRRRSRGPRQLVPVLEFPVEEIGAAPQHVVLGLRLPGRVVDHLAQP